MCRILALMIIICSLMNILNVVTPHYFMKLKERSWWYCSHLELSPRRLPFRPLYTSQTVKIMLATSITKGFPSNTLLWQAVGWKCYNPDLQYILRHIVTYIMLY